MESSVPTRQDIWKARMALGANGLAIISGVIDHAAALELGRAALSHRSAFRRVDTPGDYGVQRPDELDECADRYLVADAEIARTVLPEARLLYEALALVVSMVTDEDAITSPYQRSAFQVNIVDEGGRIGWHFDTNRTTGILCLCDTQTGPLEFSCDPCSEPRPSNRRMLVGQQAGALVILRGRERLHRCVPNHGDPKVSIVMNYYVRGDTARPAGLDDRILGEAHEN